MAAAPELDVVVIGSALVEITPAEVGRSLAEVETMVPLPSGAAANFAGVLAGLDLRVALLARVGADELGEWLVRRLAERGIATEFIAPVPDQMTPVSFAWMDQDGAKTFFFYRFPGLCDPMGALTAEQIDPAQVAAGRLFDFTEATIRNEPLRSAALRAAELARAAGREVCYAANYRPDAWRGQSEEQIIEVQRAACARADIVVLNAQEAALVGGRSDPGEAARAIGALGPDIVLVTSGERGALVWEAGEWSLVPARRVEVVYDIGAGDAFHAGFVAAHLAGMNAVRAARFASDAAAMRITRPPSAPNPSWDEVVALAQRPL